MFNAALMDYMFSNAYKMDSITESMNSKDNIRDSLDETEALELSEELMDVLSRHKLSYKDAYRVILALAGAMAIGGIEMFGPGFTEQ